LTLPSFSFAEDPATKGIPIGIVIDRAIARRATFEKDNSQHSDKKANTDQEKPQGMCLDKGYDSEKHRKWLRKHNFTPHVRSRGEDKKKLKKKKGKARRWVVERTHSWFNRIGRY